MPGRRRKNFKSFRDVAKLGAIRFEVGHRSQKDPMLADNETSELVLVPKELGAREKQWEEQLKYGIYYEDDYDYLQHLRDVSEIQDSEMLPLPDFRLKEEEEQREEDTMSVSMASTTASQLTLPSSALGSAVERDVGLLDMQAESREDWDPEILAALEDEFNFDDPDNALEDDFITKANAETSPIQEEEEEEEKDEEGDLTDKSSVNDGDNGSDDDEWTDEDTESAEEDEDCAEQSNKNVRSVSEWLQTMALAGGDNDYDKDHGAECTEDGASQFSEDMRGHKPTVSEYSAARNPMDEHKQLLQQRHDFLMEGEYSKDQRGPRDGENLGGRTTFDSELFKQAVEQLSRMQQKTTMKEFFDTEKAEQASVHKKYFYTEEKDYSQERTIDYSQEPLVTSKKSLVNCETARSTASRRLNIPAQLDMSELVMPEKAEKKKKKKKQQQEEEEVASSAYGAVSTDQLPGLSLMDLQRQSRVERLADAPNTFRPKGETTEERKDRKKEVKAMQKERRMEKSQNKAAFKQEAQRQKKVKEAQESQKRVIRGLEDHVKSNKRIL